MVPQHQAKDRPRIVAHPHLHLHLHLTSLRSRPGPPTDISPRAGSELVSLSSAWNMIEVRDDVPHSIYLVTRPAIVYFRIDPSLAFLAFSLGFCTAYLPATSIFYIERHAKPVERRRAMHFFRDALLLYRFVYGRYCFIKRERCGIIGSRFSIYG